MTSLLHAQLGAVQNSEQCLLCGYFFFSGGVTTGDNMLLMSKSITEQTQGEINRQKGGRGQRVCGPSVYVVCAKLFIVPPPQSVVKQ